MKMKFPEVSQLSEDAATFAASFTTTTFAKTGARRKRTVPDMLAAIMSPEDFGAISDGTTHTLTSLGYATLAAAQVDYPAAIALSDEADWCAIRYMLESSGGKWFLCTGKYVIPNPDLAHAIRPKSDQRIYWGKNSLWKCNTFAFPTLALVETTGVHIEGLNILSSGVFTSTAVNTQSWTPSQFSSIVGPIWTTSQSARNLTGLIMLSGADKTTLIGGSINHATPGVYNSIFTGIGLNFHSDGHPMKDVLIDGLELNDCHFGVFGYAHNLTLRNISSERYDQYPVDSWFAGHLFYLSAFSVNGRGNAEVIVENIRDNGRFLGSDSYAFTTDTGLDTITYTIATEAMSASMAVGAGVTFINGLPPAPLVMEKTYFVVSLASGVIQVANTVGGAAIDLTAQAGAGCVMSLTMPLFTVQAKYSAGLTVRNVHSQRAHGAFTTINSRRVMVSDVISDNEVWSGTLVAGSSVGGTFDSALPALEAGGAVGKWIKLTSGTGAGQARKIVGHITTGGVNKFEIDPATPWSVQPDNTSAYDVGNRYASNSSTIFVVSGNNSSTFDMLSMDRIQMVGEYANQVPFSIQAYLNGSTLNGRKLKLRDIELDNDVSRITTANAFAIGGIDLKAELNYKTRGAFPSGEKGFLGIQAWSIGYVDVYLADPVSFSRFIPNANCDVEVQLYGKNGKPIPFSGQWANEATTAGVRVGSKPIHAAFVGAGGTGTPTITLTNFGRLKYNGVYKILGKAFDAAGTNRIIVEWLVDYPASGTPTITKLNTWVTAGAALTAMDVTQSSGVLSGTITTGSSVTVTTAWSYDLQPPA